MTTSEALANPAKFVEGMSEETSYVLFVKIPPFTLRAMIGQGPELIEPFLYGGVSGSLVTVTDRERWKKLCDRFPPDVQEKRDSD